MRKSQFAQLFDENYSSDSSVNRLSHLSMDRLFVLWQIILSSDKSNCVLPTKDDKEHIAFGVDSVGVCIASCLHSVFWTSTCIWILTKLTQTHYWEGWKKWLEFGDFGLIFKVTPALWMSNFYPKSLSTPSLLNQTMDSGQSLSAPCLLSLAKLYVLYHHAW